MHLNVLSFLIKQKINGKRVELLNKLAKNNITKIIVEEF